MNFTPAGYEDNSDDDDDFYFDGSGFDNYRKSYRHEDAAERSAKVEEPAGKAPQGLPTATKEDEFLNGTTPASPPYVESVTPSNISSGNLSGLALKSGWTLLMCACADANAEKVQKLLKNGASPNESKDMFTPLMATCTAISCVEEWLIICAQALVNHGGAVDATDRRLMTPLMHAALHGKTGLCKLLIDKDASVNKQDSQGWTPLMYACQNGSPSTINLLLSHSADRSIPAFDGQRASEVAFSNGHTYIAAKLEANAGLINVKEAEESWNSQKNDVGYVRYDALDTFVTGIGCGHLLDIFKARNISFHDFLKMSDSDLCEIGVIDPIARKKILDSIADVHTSDWDISNLNEDTFKKMNTIEMSTTIAKVSKYVRCLSSSVVFVRTTITNHPEELQLDNVKQKKMLHSQCREASDAVAVLAKEMTQLNAKINKMIQGEDLKDVDLIEASQDGTNSTFRRKRLAIALGCTVVVLAAGTVAHKTMLLANITAYFNPDKLTSLETVGTVAHKTTLLGSIAAYFNLDELT